MNEKELRHFKNLHGAEGVIGLDGKRWHGTYYRNGVGQPAKELLPQNAVFNMKGEIIFHERKMF